MTTTRELVAVSTSPEDRRSRYLDMTPAERIAEMEAIRTTGLEASLRLADVIWAAETSGDDLQPYKQCWGDMFSVLLSIGRRQILPAVYREFHRSIALVRLVGRLSLSDQQRVCDGPVAVFERLPNGTATHRMVRLIEMTEPEREQVFDGQTIRSLSEQEAYLIRRRRQATDEPRPEKIGAFIYDDAMCTVKGPNRPWSFSELSDVARECRRRGWRRE